MAYLGTVEVPIEQTPFKDYTPADWAMYFVERYGQFDGGHHKAWVLDQVARVLKGTPVIITQATWDNHKPEWRIYTVDEPSEEYKKWVQTMLGPWDAMNEQWEYSYDEGVAP